MGTIGPEVSLARSNVGPFPIGCQFQNLGNYAGIRNSLERQHPGLASRFTVRNLPDKIGSASCADGPICACVGQIIANPDAIGRCADPLQGLHVVVQRNRSSACERNQPKGILRTNAEGAGPDTRLIGKKILKARPKLRYVAAICTRSWRVARRRRFVRGVRRPSGLRYRRKIGWRGRSSSLLRALRHHRLAENKPAQNGAKPWPSIAKNLRTPIHVSSQPLTQRRGYPWPTSLRQAQQASNSHANVRAVSERVTNLVLRALRKASHRNISLFKWP